MKNKNQLVGSGISDSEVRDAKRRIRALFAHCPLALQSALSEVEACLDFPEWIEGINNDTEAISTVDLVDEWAEYRASLWLPFDRWPAEKNLRQKESDMH